MKRVGEVISSSTGEFLAECLNDSKDGLTLPQAPPFGSFVKVDCEELKFSILGVVYNVQTGSADSVHHPTALNLSRQELREQQPQIFDLIKTSFSAITIGYKTGDKIFQFLPPHPPQIHDFVYSCSKEEVKQITESMNFLRTLLNAGNAPTEELVAASLRSAYIVRDFDRDFMLRIGRELSNMLKDNYDRLHSIIDRFV